MERWSVNGWPGGVGRRVGLNVVVVVTLVTAASGQSWTEIDDAPAFPAGCGQPVTGSGTVRMISGATSTGDGDFVDSYLIDIVDPKLFYATTSSARDRNALATWNTRLFLFDSDGQGMLANDNVPNATNGQSYIGAPGLFVGPVGPTVEQLEPGRYVLAITGWANDPIDAGGAPLFDVASIDIALVGPSADAGPFEEWEDFHGLVQSGPYVIAVGGVQFITEVTEPCPADVNCDLVVNVDDLTEVIIAWGSDDAHADVDRSGEVDIDDLVTVLLAWGNCR